MCAALTVRYDKPDIVLQCLIECKKMNIKVLPPDINKSKAIFSIEILEDGSKAIRYGLTAIKGVGINAAEEVVRLQPYLSIDDFMSRIHPPVIKPKKPKKLKGEVIAITEIEDEVIPIKVKSQLSKRNEPVLINSGCFNSIEINRYKLINDYMSIRKEKNYTPLIEDKYTKDIGLEYEKEYIGTYISDHPLKDYAFIRWEDWSNGDEEEIGAIIREIEVKTDKNGNDYAKLTLETLENKRQAMVFSNAYRKNKNRIIKDLHVVIKGTKKVSEHWENININEITVIAKGE